MRILFVSHYALPHLGGMEVAIDAIAEELTRRGHEVTYLASDATRPDEPSDPPVTRYRVERIHSLNALEERTGVPWPVFGPALLGALRRELARADVVHVHGFLYMSSLAALLFPRGRRAGSPMRVLTEHVGHVAYENGVLDRAEAAAIATLGRAAARRADALVYYNDKVGEELARLAPNVRRVRIENGVDLERFRPPEEGERERLREARGWDERPRALFVGRLVAKKGVDAAVAAAAEGGGSFELVLAGPGALDTRPEHVDPIGAVPRERMPELYRAADVMLLPSRGEGFPLAVQEAMASGLPVVLADDPAYRSHLAGAEAATRLVPPDAGRLADAVRELAAAPEAGARAREHAVRRFSWTAAANAHERLYAELHEQRRSH